MGCSLYYGVDQALVLGCGLCATQPKLLDIIFGVTFDGLTVDIINSITQESNTNVCEGEPIAFHLSQLPKWCIYVIAHKICSHLFS